jgi:hypothetical protein
MLDDKGMALHGINIWQSTRLLFRKALDFNNAVGLTAVLNADYGSRRGWRSSEGGGGNNGRSSWVFCTQNCL